ncbi:MAG: PKD domain-containing protein [Campylobacterota bacterium]|nr:PKD domain-containing protein [Campylobacterota bacterium]
MLSKLLFLLTAVGIIVPNTISAEKLEKIRESTIVYKLKEDATPEQLKRFNALVKKENIISKKEIKGIKIDVVKFKNIKGFEKAFSEELMATGAVKFALPDASVPHDAIPNDSLYDSQWHHTTINSPEAWDNITGPNDLTAVRVCVLDTGVDTDHPDLVGNLLLPGYNSYLEQDGNVEAILAHGTETIGLVGAVGDNGLGVAGMAWNIQIIPVKINYDDVDSYANYSDMVVGIEWCADQGVKVANLSYGGAHRPDIADAAQYLRDRGGLLFMSAGNDGTYNSIDNYPDYTSFVAVGATEDPPDNVDLLTDWSEYGPFVDIVAPGSQVYTTDMSTDGYGAHSGTSFSSPITAGLAALIYSINPDFTPEQVENFIFNTAVDLGVTGDDDVYGHGRIDAGAAIMAAGGFNTLPVSEFIATPVSGVKPLEVSFDASGSYDSDGELVEYNWDFGDNSTGTGVTTSHIYQSNGDFTATLTVIDNEGASNSSTTLIEVINEAPTAILEATPQTGPVPLNVNFNAAASYDNDGEIVQYNWLFGDGETATGAAATHIYQSSGAFTAKLTVTDDGGATDEATVLITATNIAPEASFSATPTSGDIPLSVEVDAGTSSDPDGSIELYNWDFGDGTTSVEGVTASHTYTTAGDFTITLTVTDNGGETGSATAAISAIDPNSLNAPTGLVASVDGSTVNLSWSDNSSSEEFFIIQRAEKIRGKYNFADIESTNTNVSTFSNSGLELGTYKYRVYAKKGEITSEYSNEILVKVEESVTPPPPPPPPGELTPPSDLTAVLNGLSVTLNWTDNSSDEEGFYIERAEKILGKYTYIRIDTLGMNTITFINELTSSGTFNYRVQAYKGNESSDYSNTATVRVK